MTIQRAVLYETLDNGHTLGATQCRSGIESNKEARLYGSEDFRRLRLSFLWGLRGRSSFLPDQFRVCLESLRRCVSLKLFTDRLGSGSLVLF